MNILVMAELREIISEVRNENKSKQNKTSERK